MIDNGIETPIPFAVIGERGAVWYERLKTALEAAHTDDYVAIAIETGDYAIGKTSATAMRLMDSQNPKAQLYVRRIGNRPEPELARRLFDFEKAASSVK